MGHNHGRSMEHLGTAVAAAQEAEALKILRMLDKAIKDGKNIQHFRDELDAYVEGKLTSN